MERLQVQGALAAPLDESAPRLHNGSPEWRPDEFFHLAQQHSELGCQWNRIAEALPGRHPREIRNVFASSAFLVSYVRRLQTVGKLDPEAAAAARAVAFDATCRDAAASPEPHDQSRGTLTPAASSVDLARVPSASSFPESLCSSGAHPGWEPCHWAAPWQHGVPAAGVWDRALQAPIPCLPAHLTAASFGLTAPAQPYSGSAQAWPGPGQGWYSALAGPPGGLLSGAAAPTCLQQASSIRISLSASAGPCLRTERPTWSTGAAHALVGPFPQEPSPSQCGLGAWEAPPPAHALPLRTLSCCQPEALPQPPTAAPSPEEWQQWLQQEAPRPAPLEPQPEPQARAQQPPLPSSPPPQLQQPSQGPPQPGPPPEAQAQQPAWAPPLKPELEPAASAALGAAPSAPPGHGHGSAPPGLDRPAASPSVFDRSSSASSVASASDPGRPQRFSRGKRHMEVLESFLSAQKAMRVDQGDADVHVGESAGVACCAPAYQHPRLAPACSGRGPEPFPEPAQCCTDVGELQRERSSPPAHNLAAAWEQQPQAPGSLQTAPYLRTAPAPLEYGLAAAQRQPLLRPSFHQTQPRALSRLALEAARSAPLLSGGWSPAGLLPQAQAGLYALPLLPPLLPPPPPEAMGRASPALALNSSIFAARCASAPGPLPAVAEACTPSTRAEVEAEAEPHALPAEDAATGGAPLLAAQAEAAAPASDASLRLDGNILAAVPAAVGTSGPIQQSAAPSPQQPDLTPPPPHSMEPDESGFWEMCQDLFRE
ncbi:hypothetical protein HYH03_014075 [Edaphochlamys debaryana]|uniref:Myb-like domain-containing protein n=1 Tax=Edaphochlamys debaryana TaxID=47281 RepID=A0A836BSQ8_9CHLO|nr:hypothetical protein HYH03_014075 [Edaphochlamys debaryana]|eukprot:KAG2487362.1 hypothetical protein HYH03_014075 [Edaphochlamys debaryana]